MSAELASHQLIARDVKLGRDAVQAPLAGRNHDRKTRYRWGWERDNERKDAH